jgi:hypothetical protein
MPTSMACASCCSSRSPMANLSLGMLHPHLYFLICSSRLALLTLLWAKYLPGTVGQNPPVRRCHCRFPPALRNKRRQGRRACLAQLPEQEGDAEHQHYQRESPINGQGARRGPRPVRQADQEGRQGQCAKGRPGNIATRGRPTAVGVAGALHLRKPPGARRAAHQPPPRRPDSTRDARGRPSGQDTSVCRGCAEHSVGGPDRPGDQELCQQNNCGQAKAGEANH